MKQSSVKVGHDGEAFAAEYLEKHGYRIIETNYRTKVGEIDIIAYDQDTLVFIEVKTRLGEDQGHPLEAITLSKQRRLSLCSLIYLQKNDLSDQACRFDVVALSQNPQEEISAQLLQNAFDSTC